jgi:hypothetical protein
MKYYLIACLSLALVSPSLGEKVRKVGEAAELPKNGFADYASLKTWASSSSFGGGMAGKVQISGQDIFILKDQSHQVGRLLS